MAKDPAFLFYPGDWIGGTMTLSRHLKGCYIDLLVAQFNSGPLSLEEIKTVLGSDFGPSWPTLQKKFKQADGLFFNERLEFEKAKRAEYSESRRNNRKNKADPDLKKGKRDNISNSHEKHMLSHMENENENENEIKGGAGGKVKNPKQFPTIESHGEMQLTDSEIQRTIIANRGITGVTPTKFHVLQWWSSFKHINFDGQTFKENDHEIKKHFLNWAKSQKIPNNGKINGHSPKPDSSKVHPETIKW